jgi:hypothetical protein
LRGLQSKIRWLAVRLRLRVSSSSRLRVASAAASLSPRLRVVCGVVFVCVRGLMPSPCSNAVVWGNLTGLIRLFLFRTRPLFHSPAAGPARCYLGSRLFNGAGA